MTSSAGPIYEVTFFVDPDIVAEFDAWLYSLHGDFQSFQNNFVNILLSGREFSPNRNRPGDVTTVMQSRFSTGIVYHDIPILHQIVMGLIVECFAVD